MAEVNIASTSSESKPCKMNTIDFIIKRSYNIRQNDWSYFTKQFFDTAKDLYKKDLTAHYGCVNAIEFSNDGNLLFSGGDDRRVLMWNVNNALMYYTGKLGDGAKPFISQVRHQSNIFCLAVDDENKRILSGSNDEQVIVLDYTVGSAIDRFWLYSPVFSLSLHPKNGNIFASASENGRILVYDVRESTADPLCLAELRTPFHGVMFNPCEPTLIATANSKVGVHLWDLRKPKEILCKCSDEQSMAVRWNQSGTILLALRNLLPPIIYNPLYPKKTVEFDSDSYYNACTMKSCSFAGENDEYILSGSDDFNLYVWKIPDPWPESGWVGDAHLALTGHRSIVNQVRYNKNKQLIATSGVEKIIKIWSPFHLPYSEGDRDKPSLKRRTLCSSKLCCRTTGYLFEDHCQESVDEDRNMIHFFDCLLRNELLESPPSFSHSRTSDNKKKDPKKDSKPYVKLINNKKKHLTKILMKKSEDHASDCELDPNPFRLQKKFITRDIKHIILMSSSEDELASSPQVENVDCPSSPSDHIQNDSSSSSVSLSSPSTSSSSSSTSRSAERLDSAINSPIDSDSSCSTDNNSSDKKKRHYSVSNSDDSTKPNNRNSLNFKDSGINISGSSDSENINCTIFKRKRFNTNRSYRNSSRRRQRRSSSNSSDGSKKIEPGTSSAVVNSSLSSDTKSVSLSNESQSGEATNDGKS